MAWPHGTIYSKSTSLTGRRRGKEDLSAEKGLIEEEGIWSPPPTSFGCPGKRGSDQTLSSGEEWGGENRDQIGGREKVWRVGGTRGKERERKEEEGSNGGGGLVSVQRRKRPLPPPSRSFSVAASARRRRRRLLSLVLPRASFHEGTRGGEGCLFVRAERKGEERRGRWKDRECMEQVEEE